MKPYLFLQSLLKTASPSGFEEKTQSLWIDYVRTFADKVEVDAYGNAMAIINPKEKTKILFEGHIDEIGMMVSYISEEGLIYVKGIGGIDKSLLRGQRFLIHSHQGPIPAVAGLLAIHLQEPENRKKVPELHEIYLDLGVNSKKEAEELISIGDPVTYAADFQEMSHGRFVARGCDNRIGSWAAAEALRLVAQEKKKLSCSVIALSSIQEENGLYGATMASYYLKPDVALVVDVTHATDIPNCSKPQFGEVSLGKGPVLSLGSSNHPKINEMLLSIAKKKKISLQRETNPRWTGTDADAIFLQRGGIPTVSIGVPNRYMHSPVEMIQFSDLEQTAQLLAAFALETKPSMIPKRKEL